MEVSERLRYSQCTRKVAFRRRRDAKRAWRKLVLNGRGKMNIYRCRWCGQLHIGRDDKYRRREE